MQQEPRAPLHRWRRIQLIKYLIENCDLPTDVFEFDAAGEIVRIHAPDTMIEVAINTGMPFMTNGSPDKNGEMTCNRPYGSYRPGEDFRDYPIQPNANDLIQIRQQMRLEEVWEMAGSELQIADSISRFA